VKRKLFGICILLALGGGIVAVTSPAMAAAAAPTTGAVAAATRGTSPVPLTLAALTTSATPTLIARPTAQASYTGTDACDTAATTYCINLRNGSCAAGTVVQGWRFENTDDNEALQIYELSSGRLEFTFNKCGSGMCIAHASDHDLYLSACSSSGPDTWVEETGPDNAALFTPGGGAYMWANSSAGAQMALSGTVYGETEWFFYAL
jgi:hypothetical protein